MTLEWVEVARFDSRLEAETIGHALDQYEIPWVVQSPDVGMFGPGMIGKSPVGAALMVPEDRLQEVRDLLSCFAEPPDAVGEDDDG